MNHRRRILSALLGFALLATIALGFHFGRRSAFRNLDGADEPRQPGSPT